MTTPGIEHRSSSLSYQTTIVHSNFMDPLKQTFEMDPTPDNLFISTALDDLRQQKTRLWVKTLILSILLGIFAIGTAVLAVLYGKSRAPSPAKMEGQGSNDCYNSNEGLCPAPSFCLNRDFEHRIAC